MDLSNDEMQHRSVLQDAMAPIRAQQQREAGNAQLPCRSSRQNLLDSARRTAEQNRETRQSSNDKMHLRQSFASGHEHLAPLSIPVPSLRDLSNLDENYEQVKVDELVPNKVHYGQYLVLRQIARPTSILGASLYVEDTDGSVTIFGCYNVLSPQHGCVPDATFAFPMDSEYILLEPYFKTNQENTNMILRCDHPGHLQRIEHLPVEFLPPSVRKGVQNWRKNHPFHHPIDTAQAQKYKEKGNTLYKQGKFIEAAEQYSLGIEQDPCFWFNFANRAICMLNTGHLNLCVADCRQSLELKPDHCKSRTRLASALFQLQCYDSALQVLCACELDDEAKELKRSIELVADVNKKPRLDVVLDRVERLGPDADMHLPNYFCGSHLVRTGIVNEKGCRGLFAEQPVPTGTLLFVNRALAFAPGGSMREITRIVNFGTKRMDTGTQAAAQFELVQAAIAGGRVARVSRWLAGGGFDEEVDIDLEREEARRLPTPTPAEIDMKKLTDAFSRSSFGGLPRLGSAQAIRRGSNLQDQTSSSLFGAPSLLNHSCTPNCRWVVLGNYIFVWTGVDVAAGSELTLSYVNSMDTHVLARGDSFQRAGSQWDFSCSCALCESHERNPTAFKRASELLWALRGVISDPSRDTKSKVSKILKEMRALYPSLPTLPQGERVHLGIALFQAGAILQCTEPEEAMKHIEQSFELWPEQGGSTCIATGLPRSELAISLCLAIGKSIRPYLELERRHLMAHALGSARLWNLVREATSGGPAPRS